MTHHSLFVRGQHLPFPRSPFPQSFLLWCGGVVAHVFFCESCWNLNFTLFLRKLFFYFKLLREGPWELRDELRKEPEKGEREIPPLLLLRLFCEPGEDDLDLLPIRPSCLSCWFSTYITLASEVVSMAAVSSFSLFLFFLLPFQLLVLLL